LVLAIKYYEEYDFKNDFGRPFYRDRDFAAALSLPLALVKSCQYSMLHELNFALFVDEKEYT
jgi:hypothetical protein